MEPLPSSLRAEYIEMINQHLEKLPLEEVDDFANIKKVLKSFLKSHEIPNCPVQLKDRLISIKSMIDEPELYAAPQHQNEFKQIIDDRIAQKIKELKTLTPEQKRQHLDFLNAQKAETKDGHTRMSNAKPPEVGSASHTISTDQFLREMQWYDREYAENLESFRGKLQEQISLLTQSLHNLKIELTAKLQTRRQLVETIQTLDSNEEYADLWHAIDSLVVNNGIQLNRLTGLIYKREQLEHLEKSITDLQISLQTELEALRTRGNSEVSQTEIIPLLVMSVNLRVQRNNLDKLMAGPLNLAF